MQGVGRSSAAHTPPRRRPSLLALPGATVLLSLALALALVPATEAGAQPDPQRPDHEFDELVTGRNSLTHLFDVSSMPAPEFIGVWEGTTPAITHNLYNVGRHSYQANYEAGLRILDVTGIADGEPEEVAWFDVVPERTATAFGGAWSNYPFFDSRTVLVGGFDGVLGGAAPHQRGAPWPPTGQTTAPGPAGAVERRA